MPDVGRDAMGDAKYGKDGKVDKTVLSDMVRDLIGTLEGEDAVLKSVPLKCPHCGFPLICGDPIILIGKEH